MSWMNKLYRDKKYRDQAPRQSAFADRVIFSCKTPYGIFLLEQEFENKICETKDYKELRKLRLEIKNDIHLHKVLKKNLMTHVEWKVKWTKALNEKVCS